MNARRLELVRAGPATGKLLIKPGKAAVQRIRSRLAAEVRALHGASAEAVINALNPLIRGWASDYRTVVSEEIFSPSGPRTIRRQQQGAFQAITSSAGAGKARPASSPRSTQTRSWRDQSSPSKAGAKLRAIQRHRALNRATRDQASTFAAKFWLLLLLEVNQRPPLSVMVTSFRTGLTGRGMP